jgi:hypothetical protein
MSSSMLDKDVAGGCARFEYAREAADEFLGMIGDDDTVSLLTFGRDIEWSGDTDVLMGKPRAGQVIPGR